VKNILFVSGILFIVFFNSCSEEKPDYTVVQTGSISRVNDKNVIFTAMIINSPDKISEYGFKWYAGTPPEIDPRPYMISYRSEPEGDYFESAISSSMRPGTNYNLQAYVRTSEGVSYGRVISFTGLGSETPIVSGFIPPSAGTGDTLAIWGRNLGYRKEDASVGCVKTDLSQGFALNIIRLTNDTIYVTIPAAITFSTGVLHVRIMETDITVSGTLNLE
jgi:hypothetical protein